MGALADGFLLALHAIARGIEPDPDMLVDEWADAYMVLPGRNAAEPGPYRTERTPFAREPMRCLSPAHPCRRVVAMAAAQLMKTQIALNWIGASIHQAPANTLVLLPTLSLSKRVSARISETIRTVPVLRQRVAEPRSRDARNTIDTKEFIGGALFITTAGSAANLAEIPARYIYADEVDRWEGNVDGEGDPIEIAEARTSTYETNAKLYYTSSPTIEGLSRIDTLYRQSDQRRYWVPCPHCSEHQILVWGQMRHDDAMTRAWYVCQHCGAEIDERHKTAMLAAGEWRAEACGDGQTVGFHLSALYAPVGWVSWLSLARQYAKAKRALDRGDAEPMQAFYNTRLALCWDAAEERTSAATLKSRAEDYRLRTVPRGALELTCAVDVQPSRLELMILGWGEGLERWVIDHQVLWGDPAADDVWKRLDEILQSSYPNSAGMPLPIRACCVDSGGHNTQDVYAYTRLRRGRRVLAIKGASKPNKPVISSKPSRVDVNHRGHTEKWGAELWLVGTDVAKDWLYARMKLAAGPGALHFSADLPDEFYDQLVAERKLVRYIKGYARTEWVKNKADRNEALDLAVYNLAAAHYLGLHKRRDHEWARLRAQLELAGDLFAAPVPVAAEKQDVQAPARRQDPSVTWRSPTRSFVTNWRQ